MSEDTVTIPASEYKELKRSSSILEALYAGGVDNWEWYGESLANIEDEDDEG